MKSLKITRATDETRRGGGRGKRFTNRFSKAQHGKLPFRTNVKKRHFMKMRMRSALHH